MLFTAPHCPTCRRSVMRVCTILDIRWVCSSCGREFTGTQLASESLLPILDHIRALNAKHVARTDAKHAARSKDKLPDSNEEDVARSKDKLPDSNEEDVDIYLSEDNDRISCWVEGDYVCLEIEVGESVVDCALDTKQTQAVVEALVRAALQVQRGSKRG